MYLKSLEISGFKSFAKKSILEFKTPVTAIVGPNGSGKSNTAEAFRFVLGEQSLKSMRGKRGEDMIWSGSEEVPRANRAVVKAVFDNSKRVFNLDFDEVSVERVVSRDGSNEYILNGTQVRLKDILELLSSAHIGSSGHHIISQGEADRVLTSNTKERKAMIEDALGLKIYEYKREESRKKLEKTRENINQVELLRKEIAPHLKFLTKQMEKVSKAVEVQDRLNTLYKEYLRREKYFIDNESSKIAEEKRPLLEKKENIGKELERVRNVLEAREDKDEKSHELLDIESKMRQERDNKDSLSREAGKIEGEINASEALIHKTEKKIEAGENITVALRDLEMLAEEIYVETDIESIKKKIREFLTGRKHSGDEGALAEMKSFVEELRHKKEEKERLIKEKEEILKALDQEYKSVSLSIEQQKDSSRDAEKEMMRLTSEDAFVRVEVEALRGREEKLNIINADFLREVEEAGILVGQAIVGFANLQIENLNHGEDRSKQEERRREVERLKIRLEELGASGGSEITKEYNDAVERDQFLTKELNDLNTSSESLLKLIAELQERLDVEFKQGIDKINKEFQNFFSTMFGGGSAKLELIKAEMVEDEDGDKKQVEEGLDINVSLPKKRIKGLQMLSGGERALTSIALLFAMSQVNPPPFIILDETDAALDEANSKKYGDMIETLSKYSQLILITHNRETMSRAGVIYGVTMGGSGVSKLLSIAFDEAVTVAK